MKFQITLLLGPDGIRFCRSTFRTNPNYTCNGGQKQLGKQRFTSCSRSSRLSRIVLERLEAESRQPAASATASGTAPVPSQGAVADADATILTPADAPTVSFFRGTTLNFGIDGVLRI